MVRLPGVAPGHSLWRGDILLLNHNREIKKPRSVIALRGLCHFNKEQTPLAILRYQPTVSRWFFRCLEAHLLRSLYFVKAFQIVSARVFAPAGRNRWKAEALLRPNSFGNFRHHQDVISLSFTDRLPFVLIVHRHIYTIKNPAYLR
jgi:hypothetical protein